MEIYNELMELIENPDLTLGYLRHSTRTVRHEAVQGVKEEWHHEVIREYPNGGKDVKKVVDVPGVQARDAWDEVIPIQIYVPYTAEELAAMEAERNKPTQEERLAKLESLFTLIAEKLGVTVEG